MKFKNIIRNIGANLLITILGLVGSIILARWLGPNQRGIFAAIIFAPTILQYFVNFGLSSATVYFTALPNSNKNAIWSSLVLIGFIQSIVGFLLGWFIVELYLQKYLVGSIHLGHLYLFTVPFGLFGMYATYMLQGSSHFKVTNSLKCIVPIGYCIGIIWLKFQQNLSIENLVYVQLITQFSYLITAVFFLYKILLTHFLFKIDYNFIRQILTYSVKIWFGDISQLVNSRTDQFLIGVFLSSRELGIYTIAISVAGFTGIFANAVKTIMLPSVIGRESLQEKINETIKFFKKYWIFSIFLHIIFALSLPTLIPIVFGNAYSESIIICQILIIGNLFINAKTVLSGGILGMGFPEILSYVEAIGMILSISLSILLIRIHGLIGISIAISLASSCQFLGLVILTNKKGIPYKRMFYTSRNKLNEDFKWLKNSIQII